MNINKMLDDILTKQNNEAHILNAKYISKDYKQRKLSKQDMLKIKRLKMNGVTAEAIAKIFNISTRYISVITR